MSVVKCVKNQFTALSPVAIGHIVRAHGHRGPLIQGRKSAPSPLAWQFTPGIIRGSRKIIEKLNHI